MENNGEIFDFLFFESISLMVRNVLRLLLQEVTSLDSLENWVESRKEKGGFPFLSKLRNLREFHRCNVIEYFDGFVVFLGILYR